MIPCCLGTTYPFTIQTTTQWLQPLQHLQEGKDICLPLTNSKVNVGYSSRGVYGQLLHIENFRCCIFLGGIGKRIVTRCYKVLKEAKCYKVIALGGYTQEKKGKAHHVTCPHHHHNHHTMRKHSHDKEPLKRCLQEGYNIRNAVIFGEPIVDTPFWTYWYCNWYIW